MRCYCFCRLLWFRSRLLLFLFAAHCAAWLSSPPLLLRSRKVLITARRSTTPIILMAVPSNNDDKDDKTDGLENHIKGNESEEDFRRRMALVRSLQMSYYKPMTVVPNDDNDKTMATTDSTQPCTLREVTGELLDLPLFRAPWWEVPGRSNVLNIHEPIYTNMFEKILHGPKPWTFGHLYLEGGSRNLKSDEPKFKLETWETTKHIESAAVLGCLMNISDYRRLADGRLMLLVHAMERFVVTQVQQTLPYSVVTAQLLPDAEEIDPEVDFGKEFLEQDLKLPRALAVQESVRYHDYEYDRDHVLPLVNRPDMDVSDITGSDIAKVLPYCPFSKTLQPPIPSYDPVVLLPTPSSEENERKDQESLFSLEYRLLCQGVYQTPLTDPEFPQRQHLTANELEYELWLAINNYLIQTRTPVSPVLLGLLPIHLDIWPSFIPTLPTPLATPSTLSSKNSLHTNSKSNTTTSTKEETETATTLMIPSKPFTLKHIVNELSSLDSVAHDFVQVSPDYPAHRRQRRLSYSAAHLLESTSEVANTELRPKLLAIPTTQQRLRMVLEKFDQWQESKWGEFQ